MKNTIAKNHLSQFLKLLRFIPQVDAADLGYFSLGQEIYARVKLDVVNTLVSGQNWDEAAAIAFFERFYKNDNEDIYGFDLKLNPVYQSEVAILPETVLTADGSIEVQAFGGVAPYTYNIDAGAFQPTGVFTGLTADTYTIIAKDHNGLVSDGIDYVVSQEV